MILNNNKYVGEFFVVIEEQEENKKTPNLIIIKNKMKIGVIKWYTPWRKFCFFPENNTVWDSQCISQVLSLVDLCNDRWKNQKKEKNNSTKKEV